MASNNPGLEERSPRKKGAAISMEAKGAGEKKRLAPWERNVLIIMLIISVLKITGFAIWYFGYH